ncbi:MAG: sphingolipid 4-desaturase/C4-monooxygenase [Betaproteobacteria bacterium]
MNRPMDISEATMADRSHIERRREILKAHPEIRGLIGRDRTTAWITICVVAGQICLAALFGELGIGYWWLALIGAYAIGVFANHAMFVVIHDAIHNLVFKDSRLNKLTAIFADLPNGFPTAMGFRAYHIKHHSHLSTYDYDADVPSEWEARLVGNRWYMKAGWLFFFAAFQVARISRLKGAVPGIFSRWSMINIGAIVVCDLLLLFLFGPNALLYLLASFWFSVGLHPVGARWIQEHYALAPGQGTFDYYGPLNRIQLNIGYHNEHHDFPDVPWSRLPELKAMAPEYYDGLHAHYSWTKLFFAFIFDPRYSLHTRTENMPARERVGVPKPPASYGEPALTAQRSSA